MGDGNKGPLRYASPLSIVSGWPAVVEALLLPRGLPRIQEATCISYLFIYFTCHACARINQFPEEAAAAQEMATATAEEGKGRDQDRDKKSKESVDGSKDPKPLSDAILPHILKLYASSATARDFEIYAPNATFEDPLMCAHGVKQIKSAFYSLTKVFRESKIVEYSIQETTTGPGRGEILIDNKQHYKLMGKDLDVISLIRLHIEEGKVVRHEDWWDKKPLRNRDTVKVPFLGRLAEMARRGSMFATHALMGFGKDPNP